MEDLGATLTRAGIALAVAVLLEWLLRRVSRRLPLLLTRRFVSPSASHPDASLKRAVGIVVLPLEVGLWLGVAWYVTEHLPVLHAVRDATLRITAMGFTMPLFDLGEHSYALRDLLALPAVLAVLWIAVHALSRVVESRWARLVGARNGGQATAGMLLRYTLTFVGTLIVLQAWGVDVRTLAIAGSVLGVGIGFGLQNLANNFVSGLVISLERPIKPGDYVRVGEFQGTVVRIGARCTEIVTNDRVSILVPNSKLLEQEVVSWSHGDPTCRITIPVGVAYGADVGLVRRVLLEVAKSHPLVVADPPPDVDLASFGESALDFELEVWTREPRAQGEIASDLNFRIALAFRRHAIEIPFPQRDLRLRSPELCELLTAFAQRHFSEEELARARDALAAASLDQSRADEIDAHDPGRHGWSAEALRTLAERMRGPDGLDIVDRRHHLRVYPRCFLGREAVDWLVRNEGISRERAVALGRMLVDHDILHHVLDEHGFHDDDFFYRFRSDD